MSYDLSIQGVDPESSDAAALTALIRLLKIESWGDENISVALKRRDKHVGEFYAKLVHLSRASGWVVYDPQAGCSVDLSSPGEFPPMWNPPVLAESYSSGMNKRFRALLKPAGFSHGEHDIWERAGEGIVHGFSLKAERGRITPLFLWKFTVGPPPHVWHWRQISDYLYQADAGQAPSRLFPTAADVPVVDGPNWGWFAGSADYLDHALTMSMRMVRQMLGPLESLGTLDAWVAAFEAGHFRDAAHDLRDERLPILPAVAAFGNDSAQGLALCFRALGRVEAALAHYLAYLDEYAERPVEVYYSKGVDRAEQKAAAERRHKDMMDELRAAAPAIFV